MTELRQRFLPRTAFDVWERVRNVSAEANAAAVEAARWLVRSRAPVLVASLDVPFEGVGYDGDGPILETRADEASWVPRAGVDAGAKEERTDLVAAAALIAGRALCAPELDLSGYTDASGSVQVRPAGDAPGASAISVSATCLKYGPPPVNGLEYVACLERDDVLSVLAPFREALEALQEVVGPGGTVVIQTRDAFMRYVDRDAFEVCEPFGLDAALAGPLQHMAEAVVETLTKDVGFGLADGIAVWLTLQMSGLDGAAAAPGLPLAEMTAEVAEATSEEVSAQLDWPTVEAPAALEVAAAARKVALALLGRPDTSPALGAAFLALDAARQPGLRLGLALQQHGAVAGLLAHPTTVLEVVEGSGVSAVRPQAGRGALRRHVRVGLDGLRRVLDAGLPLAAETPDGAFASLVDAGPSAGDLRAVRYVLPGHDAPVASAWGWAALDEACGRVVVARSREALVRRRREAALAVL